MGVPHLRLNDVDAVGFDLDGTLFDYPGAAADAVRALATHLDVDATDALVEAWFAATDRHFARWLAGEIDVDAQRRARMLDFAITAGVDVAEADVDDLDARFRVDYRSGWRLYPEVTETLERLRADGKRIGILTNGTGDQQRDKISATGLERLIDVVCISEEIGAPKPDAAAFEALASALEVQSSRLLFIGDNPDADIAGARAAGIRAARVRSHGREIAGLSSAVRRAAAAPNGMPARAL